MADMADDLSTPLGQTTLRRKRRFRLPFTGLQALAIVLGLFLAAFAGFAIFGENPLGGEPVAHVALRQTSPSGDKAAPTPVQGSDHGPKATAPKEAAPGEQKTVTIIDGSSGARHDVVIGDGASDKADASPSPTVMTGINQRLLEKSRYGMIPVVADGLKPFTVYAADADRAKAEKMPVVAIVIGGLGVGAAKTVDAIMKLPPAVTLAFTPYGTDPGKLAERARAQRHEILADIADLAWPRAESGPALLAPQPAAGLCWDRQLHGSAFHRRRRGDAADRAGGGQARPRLLRRRIGAAQRGAGACHEPGSAVCQE